MDTATGLPALLRTLPQVQRLLEAGETAPLIDRWSRQRVTAALRAALNEARAGLQRGGDRVLPSAAQIIARAQTVLAESDSLSLRRAVNAAGIVVHTNLGRAPLAPEALDAVSEAALSYSMLEIDPESGRRGLRGHGVEASLRDLCDAEAALVVNNNAAGLLLALSALAGGGQVIVSRGELIEIGGSFRIPDVIRQGGAQLVEVGTTNRTDISDYERAITPETRALLKVHPSNYRIVGFTAVPTLDEIVSLGRKCSIPVIEDLGSGALIDLRTFGRRPEPLVRDSVRAGADIVAFSGDKLLGGPQSGLLVGNARAIDPLRKHPLARALRIDKLSLAALEATLALYRRGGEALRTIPVIRILSQLEAEIEARAARLCGLLAGLPGVTAASMTAVGYAGGGALPDDGIPTWVVLLTVAGFDAPQLARRLRESRPAVVGRIASGHLMLDMLCVADAELDEIATAIRRVAA